MEVLLQRPREHQTKNCEEQADVQEKIGLRQKAVLKYKLDDQIDHDQEHPDQGQQTFAVRQKF